MNPHQQLGQEIQALQRGRGIGRPGIHEWLGPNLLSRIHGAGTLSDTELRLQVEELLTDASLSLPADLSYLFGMAAGIDSESRFLRERLSEAAKVLDRDPRTLSRRLREAESLLASALLDASPAREDAYDNSGWVTTRLVLDLDLTAGRPRMLVDQTITATTDSPPEFQSLVAAAKPLAAGEEVSVELLEGGELLGLAKTSERSRTLAVRVPEVRRGRSHLVRVAVEFPSADHLFPYVVFSPVVPATSLDVRVRTEPGDTSRTFWLVDSVFPPLIGDRALDTPPLEVRDGVFEAHFTTLRPGLAYGIAWEADA